MTEQLKGKSQSADSWLKMSEQYSEFFRVGSEGKATPPTSLIARIVQEPSPDETGEYKRVKLSHTELFNILSLAVQLYDKETQKSIFWERAWLPSVVAAISTAMAVINMMTSIS